MSIKDNIAGRNAAEEVFQLLLDGIPEEQHIGALRALRRLVDEKLPKEKSKMTKTEALQFRSQICQYSAYRGSKWMDVPKDYIETIADFGLQLQRYLRSDMGKKHPA